MRKSIVLLCSIAVLLVSALLLPFRASAYDANTTASELVPLLVQNYGLEDSTIDVGIVGYWLPRDDSTWYPEALCWSGGNFYYIRIHPGNTDPTFGTITGTSCYVSDVTTSVNGVNTTIKAFSPYSGFDLGNWYHIYYGTSAPGGSSMLSSDWRVKATGYVSGYWSGSSNVQSVSPYLGDAAVYTVSSMTGSDWVDSFNDSPDSGDTTDQFQLPEEWINGGETLAAGEAATFDGVDPEGALSIMETLNPELDDGTLAGVSAFWYILTSTITALNIWNIVYVILLLGVITWFMGRKT